MIEEYPLSRPLFRQEDDKHWLLSMDVCEYRGIGRFVLGLYDDIEVDAHRGDQPLYPIIFSVE